MPRHLRFANGGYVDHVLSRVVAGNRIFTTLSGVVFDAGRECARCG